MRLNIAATFDNLIADNAAPPMIVAAVESIHGAPRWHALTHPDVFEPFILDELLPWRESGWNVTNDPDRTVLAGQSLGGSVTAHLAHSHPHRFGWVIGLSVAAWWGGDDEGGLSGKQLIDAFAGSEPVGVRFFLDGGSRERELLASVQLMRDTLQAHGYDVRYREYDGGHDQACWPPSGGRGAARHGASRKLPWSTVVAWTPLQTRPATGRGQPPGVAAL